MKEDKNLFAVGKICNGPYCRQKGIIQPIENFYPVSKNKDHRAYLCKECDKFAHTVWATKKVLRDQYQELIALMAAETEFTGTITNEQLEAHKQQQLEATGNPGLFYTKVVLARVRLIKSLNVLRAYGNVDWPFMKTLWLETIPTSLGVMRLDIDYITDDITEEELAWYKLGTGNSTLLNG